MVFFIVILSGNLVCYHTPNIYWNKQKNIKKMFFFLFFLRKCELFNTLLKNYSLTIYWFLFVITLVLHFHSSTPLMQLVHIYMFHSEILSAWSFLTFWNGLPGIGEKWSNKVWFWEFSTHRDIYFVCGKMPEQHFDA